MVELEIDQVQDQLTTNNRTPWVLLLLVIVFYGFIFVVGLLDFVGSNWMYMKTGDIEVSGSSYGGGVFYDGLMTMWFSGMMIKGLLNRKKLFMNIAVLGSGFYSLYFSYAVVRGIILILTDGDHSMRLRILQTEYQGWQPILITLVFALIFFLKGYILLKKDVRALAE